ESLEIGREPLDAALVRVADDGEMARAARDPALGALRGEASERLQGSQQCNEDGARSHEHPRGTPTTSPEVTGAASIVGGGRRDVKPAYRAVLSVTGEGVVAPKPVLPKLLATRRA